MAWISLHERIWGGLLGGAVGDALGAPFECKHYEDGRRIFGRADTFAGLAAALTAEMRASGREGTGDWIGRVTDDTVLSDVLLDAILASDGELTAYAFAKEWEKFETPVPDPDGGEVIRLNRMHWIERIPYFRNRLREINKRELGHGEANATNAVMYIAPVGLLCAGDPLRAELMAVDVTAVNQHGGPRDVAGGFCAALAACFIPGASVDDVVRIGIAHTRDYKHTKEVTAMVELARKCRTCDEYIERYYREIVGVLIPLQDLQHEGRPVCVSWNSSEILGPSLATLLITGGNDAKEMVLACSRIGRDADTIARSAGGLIGTYRGAGAIPKDWADHVLRRNRWLRLEEKAAALTRIVEQRLRREREACKAVLGE